MVAVDWSLAVVDNRRVVPVEDCNMSAVDNIDDSVVDRNQNIRMHIVDDDVVELQADDN